MKLWPIHSSHLHRNVKRKILDFDLTSPIRWGGVRGGARKLSLLNSVKLNQTRITQLTLSLLIVLPALSPYQTYVLNKVGKTQFNCINKLWKKESNWNYKNSSPTNDHGIPQRHMKGKTKAEIKAFLSDPYAQIDWGLGYIEHRYGSGCKAWDVWKSRANKDLVGGWY